MASFLRHRFSQAFGLSEHASNADAPHAEAATGSGKPSDTTAHATSGSGFGSSSNGGAGGPAKHEHTVGGADGKENRRGERTLQKMASNTFKALSETLRSKAESFYSDAERARLRGSSSRLLGSLKKHRSFGSRKSRQSLRPRVDSMDTLAKMDPANVDEHPSPSLDVTIPHSTLTEPGQRYPWMGSKNGRDHSTRSRASIIDAGSIFPSPVAIAVRKSSRGATGIITRELPEALETVRATKNTDATTTVTQSTNRKVSSGQESQASIPTVQRRLSIFKVFQHSRERSRSDESQTLTEETAEVEEVLPSMGSKSEWEQARAERQRRYEQITRVKSPEPVVHSVPVIQAPRTAVFCSSAELPQQIIDNDSLFKVNASESSGSHYGSDADVITGADCAIEAIDRASGNALERTSRTSFSAESWTTSPEVIHVSADGITNISSGAASNALGDNASCFDPAGGSPRQRATQANNGKTSPESQSTSESCAITTHDSPCYEPLPAHDHHRKLSEHQPEAPEELDGRHEYAMLGSMPGVDADNASNESADSVIASLPQLRRMPATSFHGPARTSSSPPEDFAADSDLSVLLPVYDELTPSKPRDNSLETPRTVEREPTSTSKPPAASHQELEFVAESPWNTKDASEDSRSSSSVESWLRSHPDFDGEPNLNRLSSNGRTLSAELLRYSYLHGCSVARAAGDDAAGPTLLRSEENLARSTCPSPLSHTRRSSAQESAEGTDNMDTDTTRRQRESLIPIAINASRLNLGQPSTPGSVSGGAPPRQDAVSSAAKPRELGSTAGASRTPSETTAKRPTGARVSSAHTPASEPPRQVRFPDDTPEMLASRTERGAPAEGAGEVSTNCSMAI